MTILETDFIKSLCKLSERNRPVHLLQGIGDDTAVLKRPDHNLLFAADMLMDGTHFILENVAPHLVGRKALAVNLSDIAAMGGKPLAITVSVAIPESMDPEIPIEIMNGIFALAKTYNVAVCGGDTNVWKHPLVIDIAIVGEVGKKGPILRSGAQPGDLIFVTGPLGQSIQGKHLSFEPRIKEAEFLHENYQISSMIDLSDGLAKDLRMILSASKCGASLNEQNIPRSIESNGSVCTIEQALTDGEDFELCFTLSAEEAAKLLVDRNYPGDGLFEIGVITENKNFCFQNGKLITMDGYIHGSST